MTMSKLVKNSHESFPYNRNMAHALYRSTFLENWGSGIHHIIKACEEQRVEEPTWRWDGAFVYVTFKRPTRQVEEPINHRSNTDQVQKLILSMNEEYMTMNDIMECIGLKYRPTFRENYFVPALEDGAIELLYPCQPNHPKPKYSLTEKAKAWKKENLHH